MAKVRNNGVPLIEGAPRAGLTQAILELAEALCGASESSGEAVVAPGSNNWLSFWPALAKTRSKV